MRILAVLVVACTAHVPVPPPPPPAPVAFDFEVTGVSAQSHVIELIARDDGEVASVRVAPGQHVRVGDVVIELAGEDRAERVDAAQRALAEAETDLQHTSEQLTQMQAYLELLDDPDYVRKLDAPNRDNLRYAEAAREVARINRERVQKLYDAHAVSRAELDTAIAAESAHDANVAELSKVRDHSALTRYATEQVTVLHTEVELAAHARDTAREALSDARRSLDAMRIYATASGVIADVLVVRGSRIARDEPVVRMTTWQR